MNFLQWLNAVIIAVGIPAIVLALIFIGKKLQVLDTLEKSADKIKHNLKVVGDYLMRYHQDFNPNELQVLSPLQLIPGGEDFIVQVGFDKVFIANKTDFFKFIDGENPKLKFDVEVAAVKSIYGMSDKVYMNFLKILFYNKPVRNMENTAPTLGIYVRDKYLAEHPEITQ